MKNRNNSFPLLTLHLDLNECRDKKNGEKFKINTYVLYFYLCFPLKELLDELVCPATT
jgi:hypothetical protein